MPSQRLTVRSPIRVPKAQGVIDAPRQDAAISKGKRSDHHILMPLQRLTIRPSIRVP
jgi:hypothetical protein